MNAQSSVSDQVNQTELEDAIRKRTPDEQALAESTDPKARYDAKMARKGFKRKTMLTRVDAFDPLTRLNALLKGDDGDQVLADLISTVEAWEHGQ